MANEGNHSERFCKIMAGIDEITGKTEVTLASNNTTQYETKVGAIHLDRKYE